MLSYWSGGTVKVPRARCHAVQLYTTRGPAEAVGLSPPLPVRAHRSGIAGYFYIGPCTHTTVAVSSRKRGSRHSLVQPMQPRQEIMSRPRLAVDRRPTFDVRPTYQVYHMYAGKKKRRDTCILFLLSRHQLQKCKMSQTKYSQEQLPKARRKKPTLASTTFRANIWYC